MLAWNTVIIHLVLDVCSPTIKYYTKHTFFYYCLLTIVLQCLNILIVLIIVKYCFALFKTFVWATNTQQPFNSSSGCFFACIFVSCQIQPLAPSQPLVCWTNLISHLHFNRESYSVLDFGQSSVVYPFHVLVYLLKPWRSWKLCLPLLLKVENFSSQPLCLQFL